MRSARDPSVVAGWCHMWFVGAFDQARRCVEYSADEDFGRLELEALLYAQSLNNVRRGACRVLGSEAVAVSNFDARVPGLKDARDQIEHFDEYLLGVGRLQRQRSNEGQTSSHWWATGVSGGRSFGIGGTRHQVVLEVLDLPLRDEVEGTDSEDGLPDYPARVTESADACTGIAYRVDVLSSLAAASPLVRAVMALAKTDRVSLPIVDECERWIQDNS